MKPIYKLLLSIIIISVYASSCACKKEKAKQATTEKATSDQQKKIDRTINRKLLIPRDSLLKK